ncbi:MAG: YkvA family protein [Oxalicibacterium faecigallinarum]|uniref:YkvA family protein n=1 Tax=Oxalicibacterium faecigallinarum TaxID=573741 RepID=UPI0028072B53|nr:YkvA family protein [Oxalicibacterium faecigallinarum]MDQ7970376.1 YkvA family protein [Oxalicibacterium faecigallinarum]
MAVLERLRGWAVILKRDGVTLWFAARHPDVPWYAKALGVLTVAYALSPIDLIPDVIPLLGLVDDLILLPVLIWITLKMIPARVLTHCRRLAEEWIKDKKGKLISWTGGAVILLIWLVILMAVWRTWIGPWLSA